MGYIITKQTSFTDPATKRIHFFGFDEAHAKKYQGVHRGGLGEPYISRQEDTQEIFSGLLTNGAIAVSTEAAKSPPKEKVSPKEQRKRALESKKEQLEEKAKEEGKAGKTKYL